MKDHCLAALMLKILDHLCALNLFQRLCGVVLLVVITAGQTWSAEAINIRLQSGTPLEERGGDQLRRLLRTYDIHKWLFTRDVLIQSRVIPHSQMRCN